MRNPAELSRCGAAEAYPRAMPMPMPVPVPVHAVAAALRARSPRQLTVKQVHKLLYFCQGHHLADLGEPLFAETISAWDMGPVVGSLWSMERNRGEPKHHVALGEAQLNTVEYVLSRYGRLSGDDLENITHAQAPWREADAERRSRGVKSVRLEAAALTAYFVEAREREAHEIGLDEEEVRQWLAGAEARHAEAAPPVPDDLDRIRAMLAAADG